MPTYSKEELDAIRAKPEAERTEEEKKALTAADAKKPDEEHMIPKSRLDEVLRQNKDLTDRLTALETAQNTAKENALKEQGKWQDLAEQRAARIKELEGQVGTFTGYDEVLKKTLKSQLDGLAPEMQKLVPKTIPVAQQLEWLAENRSTLTKQIPTDIGVGRKGGKSSSKTAEVPADIVQAAASYGMTPEEYVKFSGPSQQPFEQPAKKEEDKSEQGE